MAAGTINTITVTKAVVVSGKPTTVVRTRIVDAYNPQVQGGPNTTGTGQIFPTGRS